MIETGLAGRVVLVTGAAAGIGRATALRFAAEGARVAIWDVHPAAGDELISAFAATSGECTYRTVDVTDSGEVQSAIDELMRSWGPVEVLVNNAGIVRDAQLVKWKEGAVASTLSDEAFDAVIDVNLRGVFHCARAVVPGMIENGGGVILNTSSIVGLYGNFGQTNYAATKAGVINMTRTWSRELGRHGIRVNAVAPGFIDTDILRSMPPKVIDGMKAKTPLRRLGDPSEIADAFLWLASDAASYVNGTVLSVDGGLVPGT